MVRVQHLVHGDLEMKADGDGASLPRMKKKDEQEAKAQLLRQQQAEDQKALKRQQEIAAQKQQQKKRYHAFPKFTVIDNDSLNGRIVVL